MAKWSNLTNVTFDEIQAGASASLTRILSPTDIEVLAGLREGDQVILSEHSQAASVDRIALK